MKKLSIAFICMFFAFATMAGDVNTGKTSGNPIRVELDLNNSSRNGNTASAFRIQKPFTFHDSCGQTITVYVSAPNGTYWADMGVVAGHYMLDHMNSSGCYIP